MKFATLPLIAAMSLQAQGLSHTYPVVLHKAEPQYTREAIDAKIEGDVILSTMIGADGVPSDIKVVRSLGTGLDEKAVECLKQWRFRPATDQGQPASSKATIEINFRLLQGSKSK
jgi:periplasmic protein TonB